MALSTNTAPTNVSQARPSRRYARELALQRLFQHEFQEKSSVGEKEYWETRPTSKNDQAFTTSLVQGVLEKQADIDHVIETFAVDWSLERMPVVDRNILRCAIFELLWVPDIPAMVTINEAVELAKRFADDETKRFVNGLLDHVLRNEVRLREKRKPERSQTTKHEISYSTPAS